MSGREDAVEQGLRSRLMATLRLRGGLSIRGVRFVLAGGIVTCVYLTSTTLLTLLGLPFQVALIGGFAVALTTHFTLQRMFVWADEGDFVLPFRHQVSRYLLVAGCQYAITATSTWLLPSALKLPTEVVYIATVALTTSANFLVFRRGIFHVNPAGAGDAENSREEA